MLACSIKMYSGVWVCTCRRGGSTRIGKRIWGGVSGERRGTFAHLHGETLRGVCVGEWSVWKGGVTHAPGEASAKQDVALARGKYRILLE